MGFRRPIAPGCWLLVPALVACDDCTAPAPTPPASVSVGSAAPSVSARPARDCTPICNDYWMYGYRWHRLCGGGNNGFDRRWNTQSCHAAEFQWGGAGVQVDVQEEGREDDAGPLCKCGSHDLPGREHEQVHSPRCDSLCARAESLRSTMDKTCEVAPWFKGYDDPRCESMEERFFALRPEIFECWCTRVSFEQRVANGIYP